MSNKLTNVELDEFLRDHLERSEIILLEEGKEQDDILAVAKAKGYILQGSNDLAGFKTIYTFTNKANINKARLPEDLLLKALPGIIGKPVDIDHNRIYVVGHYIDYKYIAAKNMVIAYGVFYKSNFGDEWKEAQRLFKQKKLATSYEIWCAKKNRKYLPDGTYMLMSIEIAGGGLMFKEKPAFPDALVLEVAMKTIAEKKASNKLDDDIIIASKKYDVSELIMSGLKLDSTVVDTRMCTSIVKHPAKAADTIGDAIIGNPVSTALPVGDKVELSDKIGYPVEGMPKPGAVVRLGKKEEPVNLVKLAQDEALRNTGTQPAQLKNDNLKDNVAVPGPQIVACANCKKEFAATPQTFQRKNSIDFYEVSNVNNEHSCPNCKAIVNGKGEMKCPPQIIDFNMACPNCSSRNWKLLKNEPMKADVNCMTCAKIYKLEFQPSQNNEFRSKLQFLNEGISSCPQCSARIPYATVSTADTKGITCPKCDLHYTITLKKGDNKRTINRANEFLGQYEDYQIGDGGGQGDARPYNASAETTPETAGKDLTMKNQPVKIRANQDITDVMAKKDDKVDNLVTKNLATKPNDQINNSGSLYLVRHGKTALNNDENPTDDRIRGWKNIPLNKEGKLQAKELGQIFKGKKIDKLYSSDLQRAYDTAYEISKGSGTPVTKKFDLRPWNLGKYQGESSEKVGPEIADTIKKTPHIKVEGGESFNNFKTRALNMARKLIEESKKKNVVAVTHTRDVKLIQAWIAAGCPDDNSIDEKTFMNQPIKTGSIHKIDTTDNGVKVTEIENLHNASIDNDTTVSSQKEGENTNMETKPEEVKVVPAAEVVAPVVDETPAEDTTVADVEDAQAIEAEEALEVSKTLKAEDRNALDNSKFAVVKKVKGKDGKEVTVRKYPIHDKAHVQNALSRLNQQPSREGLRKLGVNPETVINKVKAAGHKMGMETADMDMCCNCTAAMHKAEMEGYAVASKSRDMQKVTTRGKDNVQENPEKNPNNYVGAKVEAPVLAKKVKTGDDAVEGLTPDQVNQMQNQLFANTKKAMAYRKAHKLVMKNIKSLKKAMSEGCFASVEDVDVVMNMEIKSPGKTTVSDRGTGEKVSDGVVTGDQAKVTPVEIKPAASVETEAKKLADDLKPAKIGDKVDVIMAPAAPVENMQIVGKGDTKESFVDEKVATGKGTGCAVEVPSLVPEKNPADTAVNTEIPGKGAVTPVSTVSDDRVSGGNKGTGSDTIVRASVEVLEQENSTLKQKVADLEKIAERKKTLGELGNDLSDKDILDDDKFAVAKQKVDQAALKIELNKSSVAVAEVKETLDSGTLKSLKEQINSRANSILNVKK